MTRLTAIEAATFCIENHVGLDYWSCGYVLETILELEHNIIIDDGAWQELENILHYND